MKLKGNAYHVVSACYEIELCIHAELPIGQSKAVKRLSSRGAWWGYSYDACLGEWRLLSKSVE